MVSRDDALALTTLQAADLLGPAQALREEGKGRLVTYSPKVFIPLTKLCRDVCHYCTFAAPPRRGERAYMSLQEVLQIARAGAAAGCGEALFTLGDKPELRYRAARDELAELGCATTLDYLARAARAVLEETGLLPHLNPGVMTAADLAALRPVSASMGIMLETTSNRLSARGNDIRQRLGMRVSGCDMKASPTTERLASVGVEIETGHHPAHLKSGIDAVVISSAVKFSNPEVARAREMKIPVIARAEMLGELLRMAKVGVGLTPRAVRRQR